MNPTPKQIRALRQSHGLTMRQCAEMLQVHQSAYQHWEYGRRAMSAPMWTLFNLLLRRK